MSQRRPRGALRGEILALLLASDRPRTATELRADFSGDGATPALATVLTVLERLRRSGEVVRGTTPGGELTFRAVRDASTSTAEAMLADLLRTQDRTGALLRFAGSLDDEDAEVLRRALGDVTAPVDARPDGRGS